LQQLNQLPPPFGAPAHAGAAPTLLPHGERYQLQHMPHGEQVNEFATALFSDEKAPALAPSYMAPFREAVDVQNVSKVRQLLRAEQFVFVSLTPLRVSCDLNLDSPSTISLDVAVPRRPSGCVRSGDS
jgi:hypothetical protein